MTGPGGSSANAPSRRAFLTTSTATAVGGVLGTGLLQAPAVHAAGDDAIKIGVIGCGGRGTGAADNALAADPKVKIVALGDLFRDRLDGCREFLKKSHANRIDLPEDRCFTGFDAYKKVIAQDVDYVVLATPPGFRPMMLAAAVDAGKNIFTEKPVGVDGPGIRTVLDAYERATKKGLSIVAGTQRRHQASYLESMKRIHGGELGEITSARCYWNQGSLWSRARESSWSDMEWQIRNWLYFTWLSGDHICEQHVHNLDVVNWAVQAHPVKAVGLGGRQVRTDPIFGNIYDHFAIEYTYPNDVHVLSMARQIDGTVGNVSEDVVGTRGAWHGSSNNRDHRITGATKWRFREQGTRDPYVQEHMDLIASIRGTGPKLNELKTVAESTLTAIMGRMSTYTGQEVTWEQALNSKYTHMPEKLEFGPIAVEPIAVPGVTKLV